MGTILKFRNISKVFFRKETHPMTFNFIYDSISNKKKKFSALDNINLDIEEGEIFGLIGQNGAGKTTLLRILSQIIIPDSGKIFFKNKNIFSYKKSKYNIVPSDMAIFDLFDARMTLKFYAEIYNKKITNENIIEILKKVTLNDVSSLPINRYSTGMIQKLKFAKIIMLDPKIILFDEPTSALDIVASDMTRKNIKELKKQNKTVIVTSHDMKEIANICDRVGIIDKGKIIKIGKINDIIKETKSKKFEEAYLKLISK